MTTYTADTIFEDQVAADLLTDIREVAEEFLDEIKFPPLAMLTPGFEPAGPRGEFERIMHCLREVAAEHAPCTREELFLLLHDAATQQVVDLALEHRRRIQQGRSIIIVNKRLEVSEAVLRAFIDITSR